MQVSDALIWLNGQPVPLHNRLAGYERVPVAKRRGWHERFNWHEAILIDLNLQAGDNHVVVSLHKPGRKPWFNCVRFASEPTTALWSLIENDFPRSGHSLLEHVDVRWFNVADGWLSEKDTPQFERPFVEQLLEKLGADGAAIRGQLTALLESQTTSSDTRWLDLCVSAAELHAALSQTATLRAAVVALAAAYPHQYRGRELLDRVDELRARLLGADHLDPAEEPTRNLLSTLADLKREALVTGNPLLAGQQLLLVKRDAFDSDHYYDEFITGTHKFGGGLFTLSMPGRIDRGSGGAAARRDCRPLRSVV